MLEYKNENNQGTALKELTVEGERWTWRQTHYRCRIGNHDCGSWRGARRAPAPWPPFQPDPALPHTELLREGHLSPFCRCLGSNILRVPLVRGLVLFVGWE